MAIPAAEVSNMRRQRSSLARNAASARLRWVMSTAITARNAGVLSVAGTEDTLTSAHTVPPSLRR